MNVLPFIPKEDPQLPDAYGIHIWFIDGKEWQADVAQHTIKTTMNVLECVTKDDVWQIFPLSNIKRIEFDKRFSQIVAIKAEKANGV